MNVTQSDNYMYMYMYMYSMSNGKVIHVTLNFQVRFQEISPLYKNSHLHRPGVEINLNLTVAHRTSYVNILLELIF